MPSSLPFRSGQRPRPPSDTEVQLKAPEKRVNVNWLRNRMVFALGDRVFHQKFDKVTSSTAPRRSGSGCNARKPRTIPE